MGKSKSYTVKTFDGGDYTLSSEQMMALDVAAIRDAANKLEVVDLALTKLRSSIAEQSASLEASWQGSFAPPANTRMLACSQSLYNALQKPFPDIIVTAREIADLLEHYQRGGK